MALQASQEIQAQAAQVVPKVSQVYQVLQANHLAHHRQGREQVLVERELVDPGQLGDRTPHLLELVRWHIHLLDSRHGAAPLALGPLVLVRLLVTLDHVRDVEGLHRGGNLLHDDLDSVRREVVGVEHELGHVVVAREQRAHKVGRDQRQVLARQIEDTHLLHALELVHWQRAALERDRLDRRALLHSHGQGQQALGVTLRLVARVLRHIDDGIARKVDGLKHGVGGDGDGEDGGGGRRDAAVLEVELLDERVVLEHAEHETRRTGAKGLIVDGDLIRAVGDLKGGD